MDNNLDNNQKIDKASATFKRISANHKYAKGKHLPNWLNKKAYILDKECGSSKSRFYNEYKNGHIIMLDFGTNIGSEFCNNHFAIVLNKNDNKLNSMLTVIPLSSKNKRYYHKLNDEVFKLVIAQIKKEMDALIRQAESLQGYVEQIKKIRLELESTDKTINNVSSDELKKELKSLENSTKSELKDLINKLDELKCVAEKYSKFKNDSYACVLNIQTVSKLRILKSNDADPIGKIRLSKATMDILDKKLIETLTNYKLK